MLGSLDEGPALLSWKCRVKGEKSNLSDDRSPVAANRQRMTV